MSRARLPLVLAVSVVALLFAACNSGGDTTSPTATVTSNAGTVATPDGTSEATETAEATATGEPTTSTPEPTATPEAATEIPPPETATPEATQTSVATPEPTAEPTPAPPEPVEAIDALAGREFSRPIELDSYPGDRVFVAEQDGLVLLFNHDGSGEQVLLDIQGRVSRAGWEEGLLSVALDPGFAGNGHLWAYYSAANPQRSVIARFTVTGDVANPASELVVLAIEQPFANHNGGALRFGFDGMLYLGLGDGGSGNDPLGSGQDRSTLLGSIIRLDVRNASVATPYVVPADNPFVGEAGVRPEIWAYGMRNPWRMAFDPVTGALWVGDVGQGAMEEISVIRRGANYGWDIVEGTICHEPASGCDTEGLTFPVAVYDHSGGRCSITGGMVYRGSAVPEIAASYIYGDHCSGEVWALPVDGSSEPVLVASDLGDIIAFGVDGAGEVYVMRFGQSIVKLVSP